jgi:hypothetical protein
VRGAKDADRDLAAVGDEQFRDRPHGRLSVRLDCRRGETGVGRGRERPNRTGCHPG